MEIEGWEALNEAAVTLIAEVQGAAGASAAATVEWFDISATSSTVQPYRVDEDRKSVALNRDIVKQWLRDLPHWQARARFDALVLRAASALLFAPPAWEWKEACELHVRSVQEGGLDEAYARAFEGASAILESHRLDQRLLDLMPDAGDRLTELVLFELEGRPTFDTCPRAAIVMGRTNLPSDVAQPVFDEFLDRFGIDEADELGALLNAYVSLSPDSVDAMVDLTFDLIFDAFPEAMGLAVYTDDEGPSADALWDLKARVPADDAIRWVELEVFVIKSLTQFTGHAGLDYGDALLIGLDDDALGGPRIAAWAGGNEIHLDVVDHPLPPLAYPALISRGWEAFENAPQSFYKQAAQGEIDSVAQEVVWILRDLEGIPTPAGLTVWARGPAAAVARILGWTRD